MNSTMPFERVATEGGEASPDAGHAATVGSARQVLLAIAVGDDIVLASKAAIAAASAPGSQVLVVHVAQAMPPGQSRLDAEPEEQIRVALAQAIKLIEGAGISAHSLVARPVRGTNVIANIAEEWHADMTVMGSSQRRDLATMITGVPA
jgi:nucleotide-binding universal stress UspA family protein